MKTPLLACLLCSVLLCTAPAFAQAPAAPAPAAAPAEPQYPVIRVGVVSYLQYLTELENRDGFNSFDVTRAYLNVNGQLSRNLRFRFTPDIRRVTDGSLAGSLTLRMKYAFVQWDNPTPGGSLRFGQQPTPWVDFEQSINRYRVQGTMFSEREGLIPSSGDFGAGYSTPLGAIAELHAGVFNGEGSSLAETNKYKSVQARVTVRPLAGRGALNGIRLSGFVNAGWYGEDRPRHLAIGMISFEQTHIAATAQLLTAIERPLVTTPADIDRSGQSYFLELRQGTQGWAGLLRLDRFDPDEDISSNEQQRVIAGGAYWFVWPRSRVGVIVTDELVRYEPIARPDEHRLLVQAHIEF